MDAYQEQTAQSRDRRMQWWRDARFGMMIHFGIYSVYGRGEWIRLREGIPANEYRAAADRLSFPDGTAEKWARLAKNAGMKYVVLTTQHHDGFALWDSEVNPFNAVRFDPHKDIIAEYVSALRNEGLKVGFYFSLWNWEHPDGSLCASDLAARKRFTDFVTEEVRELMTNYGKIDILWYDVPSPLKTAEEWDSLTRNKMVRQLQPDIIINNRSKLDEDFCTPEDKVETAVSDWEACMRFTPLGFGGVTQEYAAPYRMNAEEIVKLLSKCGNGGGNLLFNISPDADGSVSVAEEAELLRVGRWIHRHSDIFYGAMSRGSCGANGVCTAMRRGSHVYLWNFVWKGGDMVTAGYQTKPVSVTLVTTGQPVDFTYESGRIIFRNLPEQCPDDILHIPVFDIDFGVPPTYRLFV